MRSAVKRWRDWDPSWTPPPWWLIGITWALAVAASLYAIIR